MMNKIIRTTLIALLLTFAAHAAAQQGLQIATVFQKYGKQKGVTMVELSNEMLETYQMTLYKSLVFKDASDALPKKWFPTGKSSPAITSFPSSRRM